MTSNHLRLIQLLMKKIFLRSFLSFGLFIICCLQTQAQQVVAGTVSGSISDTSGKQSMNGATITLFDLNDSSAAPKYVQAKAKGTFEIKNMAEGRYRLLVTFEGYENQSKIFSITKTNNTVSLDNIIMTRKS